MTKKGVLSAKVNLADKRGVFEYDPAVIAPDIIKEYVDDMGFEASFGLPPTEEKDDSSVITLSIKGMTCQSCVKSIETSLGDLNGVEEAKVDLKEETGCVRFCANLTSPEEIVLVVEDAGFDVRRMVDTVISVQGMTCNSCVQTIEHGLREQEGVLSVRVSLQDAKAFVTLDPSLMTSKQAAEAIYDMGFDTEVVNGENASNKTQVKKTPRELEEGLKVDEDVAQDEDESEVEKCFVSIQGMTCASCVAAIEKHVKKINGTSIQCRNKHCKYLGTFAIFQGCEVFL